MVWFSPLTFAESSISPNLYQLRAEQVDHGSRGWRGDREQVLKAGTGPRWWGTLPTNAVPPRGRSRTSGSVAIRPSYCYRGGRIRLSRGPDGSSPEQSLSPSSTA